VTWARSTRRRPVASSISSVAVGAEIGVGTRVVRPVAMHPAADQRDVERTRLRLGRAALELGDQRRVRILRFARLGPLLDVQARELRQIDRAGVAQAPR
jgi:hypothetical protein